MISFDEFMRNPKYKQHRANALTIANKLHKLALAAHVVTYDDLGAMAKLEDEQLRLTYQAVIDEIQGK